MANLVFWGVLGIILIIVLYYFDFPWIVGTYIVSYSSVNNFCPSISRGIPVGIASYGPFSTFSQVTGYANISSINVSGASLQLNNALQVDFYGGQQINYWVQNVLVISPQGYYFVDNVWSLFPVQQGVLPQSIVGNGGVSTYNSLYYYAFSSNRITSSETPIRVALMVNTSLNGQQDPVIYFSYAVLNSQNQVIERHTYDKVTIKAPAVMSYFIRTPNKGPPFEEYASQNYYLYFDSELVFGGPGDGSSATFNSLNASLLLAGGSGKKLNAFSSLCTYGWNTAESSTDLHVSLSNGIPTVYVGGINKSLLTTNLQKQVTNVFS
ncbi:thermopsin [Candidatus Parvarchaeota archaeon]|nr:thermopsin [Candidatus Parvarchaeota archaeon]